MKNTREPERFQVVVIGGGQAGLSVGYHLSRLGVSFVILDANERVGDSWRNRWDSLHLFTPAQYDGLDGLPFPAPADSFPTKDEMADYLEAYAAHFALPVRTGVRVESISKNGEGYVLAAGDERFEAAHVVVAMSSYQTPRVPPFARELDPRIVQLHSFDYRNLSQLQEGGVLVVGAGNSGAEIALEASRRHEVWMSGRDPGHLPFRIDTRVGHVLQRFVLRFLFHRVLTTDTSVGRKARPKLISQGAPLIRIKPEDLAAAGVRRAPRMAGVEGGLPLLADGHVIDVANVVWCTGFQPRPAWIDFPIFGEDGEPVHERGFVPREPGLAFVGLHFLYAMSSTMIHGVGRDAEHVARRIAEAVAAGRRAAA
ncbi:MAG: flavin-containing monooxygenase [Thermoanaerobaculia bacterium]